MKKILVRQLGKQHYLATWEKMKNFTQERDNYVADELWLVEHYPVFTQGQAGKAEHVLCAGDIPIVQTDRGGQVTYHGPGQVVIYTLLDLRRLKLGVRDFVSVLERAVIALLADYGIKAVARHDAPGVYVGEAKICSLGLKIKRGCSYHGLALNVNMDLAPFTRINPCGYKNLPMAQMSDFVAVELCEVIGLQLSDIIVKRI
jgi:lipoyl(octanoyl) transferase